MVKSLKAQLFAIYAITAQADAFGRTTSHLGARSKIVLIRKPLVGSIARTFRDSQ
jgi:hypothetical protein